MSRLRALRRSPCRRSLQAQLGRERIILPSRKVLPLRACQFCGGSLEEGCRVVHMELARRQRWEHGRRAAICRHSPTLDLDTTSPATCAASTTPSPPATTQLVVVVVAPPAASPRAGRRTWPSCAASTWPTTSGASRDPSSAAYSPSRGSPHTHPTPHPPASPVVPTAYP